MSAPFHLPSSSDLILFALIFMSGVTFDVIFNMARRKPVTVRPLLPWAVFVLAINCTTSVWPTWIESIAYILWTVAGDRDDDGPGLFKSLGSLSSGLTDAVRGALKREQTQAFS